MHYKLPKTGQNSYSYSNPVKDNDPLKALNMFFGDVFLENVTNLCPY